MPPIAVVSLFHLEDVKSKVRVVMFTILALFWLPEIIEVYFNRSYATPIPLSKIKNWEVKEVPNEDLELDFMLYFESCRISHDLFRKERKALHNSKQHWSMKKVLVPS